MGKAGNIVDKEKEAECIAEGSDIEIITRI